MNITIAIKKAGSVSALARILGVSRQAVQQFRSVGLPAARVDTLREARPEWFSSKSMDRPK
jgi:DNA-binding transcriptional regulator YdaS (Cro superfamily)